MSELSTEMKMKKEISSGEMCCEALNENIKSEGEEPSDALCWAF